jgi:hypothetical protein
MVFRKNYGHFGHPELLVHFELPLQKNRDEKEKKKKKKKSADHLMTYFLLFKLNSVG